ncbi:hypothetical protein ACI2KH_12610 [Roseomonas mucosa]|uniref:hypothetical protein n=1 Tax=Roseomonas mucosa TaxID=207340 RepID=UPI003850764A
MTNHPTPERQALEAEADRLLGVYIRITLIARRQKVGLLEAGAEAVERGVASAEDWSLIREMANAPSEAEERWRHRLDADPRSLG